MGFKVVFGVVGFGVVLRVQDGLVVVVSLRVEDGLVVVIGLRVESPRNSVVVLYWFLGLVELEGGLPELLPTDTALNGGRSTIHTVRGRIKEAELEVAAVAAVVVVVVIVLVTMISKKA